LSFGRRKRGDDEFRLERSKEGDSHPLTGVENWGEGLHFESHIITRIRLSTTDTSFGDLIGRAESSSKVDEEAERTSWLAAIESPERSETEPEGTIDGGFD